LSFNDLSFFFYCRRFPDCDDQFFDGKISGGSPNGLSDGQKLARLTNHFQFLNSSNHATMLKIALSKGRILDDTLPLLATADIVPIDNPDTSRKLILDTNHDDVKLVLIRASDVPTYVEYGAADIGVAGKDVLMEYDSDDLYEPLDLKIARCRLMVAGRENTPLPPHGHLRIATKYTKTTQRYYAQQGIQVEVIKLYGSMELAPLVGLADFIVDLVETGNTLRANGLVELEQIAQISSRLVVNKAAMKIKYQQIKRLITQLEHAVARKNS